MDMQWEAGTIDYDAIAALIMNEADADADGNLTAEEMANVLFYEFQITPNENKQAFVENLLSDVCGSYDVSGDGLSSSELIDCLQVSGQDIWQGSQDWKESRAGDYDPQVWYDALQNADTDSNGQLTASEGIAALEAYLGFTLWSGFEAEFETDIGDLCSQYDGDETAGLTRDETIECLTAHGQWIWEEMSFYKAASTNMSA